MGRIPLIIFGKKNGIKNWERIALKKQANHITATCYKFNLANNTGWPSSIRDSITKIGLGTIFSNATKKSPNTIIFCREKDIFHQEAFRIQKEASKLKTMSFLKTDWFRGVPNYNKKRIRSHRHE